MDTQITVADVVESIRVWMRTHHVNQKTMAQKSGLSTRSLDGMFRDDWQPGRKTLDAMQEAIGRYPWE